MPLLGHNKHFWNMSKSWISVFFVKLSALTGSQQANKTKKKRGLFVHAAVHPQLYITLHDFSPDAHIHIVSLSMFSI